VATPAQLAEPWLAHRYPEAVACVRPLLLSRWLLSTPRATCYVMTYPRLRYWS